MNQPSRTIAAIAAALLFAALVTATAGDEAKEERRPGEFAVIFNMGYANDALPRDPEDFEKLITSLKAAHYNVVLCRYEDWRATICKKHGMRLMVDLLVSEHHVYKEVEAVEELCRSLRESDTIYAYHLWSDRIGGTSAGRSRDVGNIHEWGPHHAAYVGSYNGRAIGEVEGADLIGYYDFHWKRGGLWRHLQRMADAAREADALFLKYTDGAPGRVGAGNYNRVLYTLSTSIAFGLKGYMYHYTGAEIDTETWEWKALGEDLARVNAEIQPLCSELVGLGNPSAVYSTPTSKTAKDRDTGEGAPTVPAELVAIPPDAWFQVQAGEAVVGVFQASEGRGALVFANHNAYQPQEMRLEFDAAVKSVSQFDRETGNWKKLTMQGRELVFRIPAAAAELLRIGR